MSLNTQAGEGAFPPCSSLEAPMTGSLRTTTEEREFYNAYAWAVNAFPTVAEAVSFLREEIRGFRRVPRDWRMREVMTNIWLLASGISDAIDDLILGECYDLSALENIPLAGAIAKPIEKGLARWSALRTTSRRKLLQWRHEWEGAVEAYLLCLVQDLAGGETDALGATSRLESLLADRVPREALRRRLQVPSAFRSQDLTIYDLLSLAHKFAAEDRDRSRPILVVGCRTAGSYFAPILRACLKLRGCDNVDSVTVRPNKGTSTREELKLTAIARLSGLVAITDEPIGTGATLIKTIRLLQRAGIMMENIIALLPIHPHNLDFCARPEMTALRSIDIVRLEPEERYRERALKVDHAELVLRTYFEHNHEHVDSVVEDGRNAWLDRQAETTYHSRLKRLYEVRVRKRDGSPGTRYVLGKSVGCGWLSYHAFLAGARLSRFVTPLLGLRDGIMYTEWLPQQTTDPLEIETSLRDRIPLIAARYIAARTGQLKLPADLASVLAPVDRKALTELARVLAQARGRRGGATLKKARLFWELRSRPCPVLTLIDGRMRPQEWVADGLDVRKSDFEHHGQGKLEINAADPAYDLADTILTWNLSRGQEEELIREYSAASGDYGVHVRLFYYKLLAGTWSKARAIDNLADARLLDRHEEFSQQYMRAVDFLTEHTARLCGSLCGRPATVSWKSPLVVLDVDGVVDTEVFGYPSSTAAANLAISILHAHGYSLAFNSARSLRQLKLYCEYYGGVGVVAEYGGVVWDSVSGRDRVLVSGESLRQLEGLKVALRQMPGVFLNSDYQHSIRAHVFERGSAVALPEALIGDLMVRLQTDRVQMHKTVTTSTLVASETDKGTGLTALLDLAGHKDREAMVIGDSAPDLAMFRIGTRSYAPSHIPCRSAAELLGCRIATRSYQRGFLESARAIVHPDGKRCNTCKATEARFNQSRELFMRLLRVADRPRWFNLLSAIADPRAVAALRR